MCSPKKKKKKIIIGCWTRHQTFKEEQDSTRMWCNRTPPGLSVVISRSQRWWSWTDWAWGHCKLYVSHWLSFILCFGVYPSMHCVKSRKTTKRQIKSLSQVKERNIENMSSEENNSHFSTWLCQGLDCWPITSWIFLSNNLSSFRRHLF